MTYFLNKYTLFLRSFPFDQFRTHSYCAIYNNVPTLSIIGLRIYRTVLRIAFFIFLWVVVPSCTGGAENAANPAPPVKLNVGLALASNDGTEPDEKLKPPEDDPGAFVAAEPKLKLPEEPMLPVLLLEDPKLNPALFSAAALPKLNIPFAAEFWVGFVSPNVGVA